ncbi:protein-glutamate O-methyltransferase CheR [uncultured Desulfobacter sp.]|uniref:CheR family methyltransferase n=1 Tax=uncultured Desulfobacter sp. TaxID=240139 RepID=UPI0029F52D0F|nr:protein-glutamate O-methyltransferase CheR [uncultured Desulfobacter sp.]
METTELEKLEVNLLLEAVFQRYGHDFRQYARASVHRRIHNIKTQAGLKTVSALIPRVLHEPLFFEQMLREMSITVTTMFRNPGLFLYLRHKVLPYLKSYPSLKIWHAGCATGQEAYSLSILLKEENLTKRTVIYATDFNDTALDTAKKGIYDLKDVKDYTKNYQAAGGSGSFSEYYHAEYGAMKLRQCLKDPITFANHNLAIDGVFSETQLILCRNVLIYFDKKLQNRVLNLFYQSLAENGFLCLGSRESIICSTLRDKFVVLDEKHRIFQKKTGRQHV